MPTDTAENPTSSDTLAPNKSRVKMSLPMVSVPR